DEAATTPVDGAHVELVGTRFVTVTRADGRFALGRVPAGSYALRITRIGYRPALVDPYEVPAGDGAPALDVALVRVPIRLADVVVTPGYFGLMQASAAAPRTLTRQQLETVPQIGEDIYRAVSRLPGATA